MRIEEIGSSEAAQVMQELPSDKAADVAEAAACFADALAAARHYLHPIPQSAIEDVLSRSSAQRGTVH
jgi:hypothetical protein